MQFLLTVRFKVKGLVRPLADAAMSHFQEAGCETCYALVDRYNSPSWNMFLHKGFTPFEFNEQFKVFGWKILSLWLDTRYFFNPGTFILRKANKGSQVVREVETGYHFLLAWLGFSFVLWMISIRHDVSWLNSIPFVLGVAGVSIFVHELSHKIVANSLGIKTIFKVWASGLIFSAFIALSGTFLPFYGSTYIRQTDWAYNRDIKRMGLIYIAGPVVSLVIAFCFLGLTHWTNAESLVVLGIVGFWTNFVIVLFNLIPISPFDGRKIFLWNKTIWSLLVIGFTVLVGVKTFLYPGS